MERRERIAQVKSLAKNNKEAIEMLLSGTGDIGSEKYGMLLSASKFGEVADIIIEYFGLQQEEK